MDGFSTGHGMILEDVNIWDALFFEIVLEFFAPLGQEIVPAGKQGVGLLGRIELLTVKIVLHFELGCNVRDFGFKLIICLFQIQDITFIPVDQLVESILFQRVSALKLAHFLSILIS